MDWHLRTHILSLAHAWPLPFAAFVIGVLLGFGAAFLLPTPYRAEADLFVTYNADAIYTNPDDYKNWQLKQLNDLSLSEPVMAETLRRLQAANPALAPETTAELRPLLRTLWRNTGRWRLVVESPSPAQSELTAGVWSQVYLEMYEQAVSAAAQALALDSQLQALGVALAAAQARLDALEAAQAQLAELEAAAGLDERAALEAGALWQARAALGGLPELQPLLTELPESEVSPPAYSAWLRNARAALETAAATAQYESDNLAARRAELLAEYQQSGDASLGLSSMVEVGPLTPVERAQPIRPIGLTALVGGLLGLFTWVMLWLVRPVLPSKK